MRKLRVEATGFRACTACLLLAMVSLGCLSSTIGSNNGTGGNDGTGGNAGQTGPNSSTGGVTTAAGTGGFHENFGSPGSCDGEPNPDVENSGPCSAAPASPPRACTRDCCTTCGIDAAGTNVCACSAPTGTYSSCTCSPPIGFPVGLTGGACSPQGYASLPAATPAGGMSLKGLPCTKINTVCFTAESTPTSPRGCICMADETLHCGSVHGWFTLTGGETTYN